MSLKDLENYLNGRIQPPICNVSISTEIGACADIIQSDFGESVEIKSDGYVWDVNSLEELIGALSMVRDVLQEQHKYLDEWGD
jgi:hypothetical protein